MRFKARVLAAAACAAALALPASAASAASAFHVTVNGGVLIASRPLHPGEVITRDGTAYRVVYVRPLGAGRTVFRTVPQVTASGSFAALG